MRKEKLDQATEFGDPKLKYGMSCIKEKNCRGLLGGRGGAKNRVKMALF